MSCIAIQVVAHEPNIRMFLKTPEISLRCPRLCTNGTIGLIYGERRDVNASGYLEVPD
jgi:hypothetical protein